MVISASPPSVEWERAQQVQISVDLITVAKQELGFLNVVDGTPALKDRQTLERAVHRYLNYWLPLASKYEPKTTLLPPLDCAWVWHCHKLNPVRYAKDCQQMFGKLVDVAAAEPNRESEAEAITITKWAEDYPSEPYHFIRAGQSQVKQLQNFTPPTNSRTVAYDLIGAIERQTSFYFQVSRPWMLEDRFLQLSLERYRGFLHLINLALLKEREGGPSPFVVPTYDIDLLWHSHQLCPTAYREDTVKCMGKILDHDDSDSNREAGAKLHTSFVDTCEQWLTTFGTVYEQAGSLYREQVRSAPPTPSNENLLEVVTGNPVNMPPRLILDDRIKLLGRQTLQVNLVIFGASNIICPPEEKGRKRHFYVRVTALRRCPGMRLTTLPIESSSSPPVEAVWNEGFSLQAELSTEGLRMELMSYTTKKSDDGYEDGVFKKVQRKILGLKKKPRCLGEISIDWKRDLLNSVAGLSLSQRLPLVHNVYKGLLVSSATQLHFSVSITPPTPAPYIFRMVQAPVTDDTGLQVARMIPKDGLRQRGRWLTRTVVDHSGKEQFVVRTRWASGVTKGRGTLKRVSPSETVINLHQGPLQVIRKSPYHRRQSLVRIPFQTVSSAKQLPSVGTTDRSWSLFEGAARLTVTKPASSCAPLDCQVEGDLGYPMRLLSGRWLDYEVDARGVNPNAHEKEEAKYLTLVRYTTDAPMGKATALINWQSAAMEVKPEESVVLVVMISMAVSVSLLDMKFNYPRLGMKDTFMLAWAKRKQSSSESDGHLGAMLVQRNGLSHRWNRPSSNRSMSWEMDTFMPMLFYSNWYDLSSNQIYSSGVGGAVCGGGGCGGGGCGGGCGGGGCGGG